MIGHKVFFATLYRASKKQYEGVFTCVCFEKIPKCFKHCKEKWEKYRTVIFLLMGDWVGAEANGA